MRAYVTKYALTRGILEMEVEEPDAKHPNMVIHRPSDGFPSYFHKGEWFRTEVDALAKVDAMLARKKASLEKQLRELAKTRAKAMQMTRVG